LTSSTGVGAQNGRNHAPSAAALTYASEIESLEDEFHLALQASPDRFTPRDFLVLELFWGLRSGERSTLEAIGAELGITRERVRQIRDRAVPVARNAMLKSEPPSVVLLDELLECRGGMGSRAGLLEELERLIRQGGYRVTPFFSMLFEIGVLPNVQVFGELAVLRNRIDSAVFERSCTAMNAALSAAGVLLSEQLADCLDRGWPALDRDTLDEHARLLMLRGAFEVLPGMYAERRWSQADFGEFILEESGSPLHFSEIARRVAIVCGKPVLPNRMNSVLNSSGAFVRVGSGDFALAKWGAAKYGRFDEVIERYFATGRLAEHIDRIKSDLLATYTVADSTVQAMLSVNRNKFHHFGGGYWGLRGYEPIVDQRLSQAIATMLERAGAMTLSDVVAQIALRPELGLAEDAARALFVSSRFERFGGHKSRLFRAHPGPSG
jgi:hypothetical protein